MLYINSSVRMGMIDTPLEYACKQKRKQADLSRGRVDAATDLCTLSL
jgi:hypothetical protein